MRSAIWGTVLVAEFAWYFAFLTFAYFLDLKRLGFALNEWGYVADFFLEIAIENIIQTVLTDEIVTVYWTFLANSVGSVFRLDHDAWSPM